MSFSQRKSSGSDTDTNKKGRNKGSRVLLIIAIICFVAAVVMLATKYIADKKVSYDTYMGDYQVSAFTFADISDDGSTLVANDNYERVIAVDLKTNKLKWICPAFSENSGYSYFEDVFLGDNGEVYAYNIEMDEDALYVLREEIVRLDPSGNVEECYILQDYEYGCQEDETLYGFQIFDDWISYISFDEKTISIRHYDINSGVNSVTAQYFVEDYVNIKWGSACKEQDTYLLTCNTGEVCKVFPENIEVIRKYEYSLEGDEPEGLLPGIAVEDGADIYVLDKSVGDAIYLDDGSGTRYYTGLRQLLQVDEKLNFYDYIYQYAIDNMIMNFSIEGDEVLVVTPWELFLTKDGEVTESYGDTFKMSFIRSFVAVYRIFALPVMIALFVISVILFILYSFVFHPSILGKMIILVIPVVLLAGGVIMYMEYNRVEKIYYDDTKEQLTAICDMAKSQIDGDELSEMKNLDAIEEGKVQELIAQVDEIFSDSGADWRQFLSVNIYDYKPDGVNRIIYGEDNDNDIFDYFWFITLEDLEPERVGDSDIFIHESSTMTDKYMDAVTPIENISGEVVALLNIEIEMGHLTDALKEIRKNLIITLLAVILVLTFGLIGISNYISSRLHSSSMVISEVAQGDFSKRVKTTSRDELGVIGNGVNLMAEQIEDMIASRDKFTLQVVEALVGTVDAKDKYTNGHSIRVAEYSVMIAKRLGKNEEEIRQIYYAGILHDIGKIGVPDEIINKTSRLTDEEFAKIKTHPEIGYEILKNLSELGNITVGAYSHHERIDGRGYPQGLKGDEIPEIARIIGVADTYDAMTSNRSYRHKMPQEKVRAELERAKGTQLDAQFAQIMLDIDLEMYPNGYPDSEG